MLKNNFLKSWLLLLCMIVGASSAWATAYISYNGNTQDTNTPISASNVSSGTAGKISWTGKSCTYSSSRVNIAANGSITFTADTGYSITKIVITSGSSSSYYGTWTSSPSVTPSSSSGVTTFDGLNANSVTVTTSTAFRCTSASDIKVYYAPATVDLTDDEFSWSASSYTATIEASNSFPSLTNTEGVSVTYQSTNTSAATINSSTGAISLVAAGETTIKAVFAGNGAYNAKTVSYDLTVLAAGSVAAPTFSEEDGASLELGSTVTITAPDGCTLKYQFDDGDVEVVDDESTEVELTTVGDVTLKAWSVKDAKESDMVSIDLTVTKHPITPSFASASVDVVRGNNVAAPALSGNTGNGTVTYASSDTNIATVDENTGVVSGVAIGSTTITATIAATATYLGNTATFTVNVTKPYHTVTFSVNGNTSRTASVQEDAAITFPTAAETPADASEFNKEINGMTFVGWYGSTYTHASTAPSYVNTSTTTMGSSDVTYYAVYADEEEVESDELEDCELAQTLQYDTWTYSGSTTNKSSYRLFHTDSYIESAAFDLSKLMKVIVYGGTFGGSDNNSLTIGDGTNTWKNVTVSGKSETGVNTYTGGTALSGTKALRITCNSGSSSGSGTGVRISKIEIFVKGKDVSYSNFCTTVSALPRPVITMANVEMTWGDTGKKVAPSATVEDEAVDGTYTFASSDNTKLTVASDGTITCNVPGTYTVTATITATEDYQATSANCTVTVNKKDITLAFANDEVDKLTTDGSYTQNATVTPAAYDGTIAYTLESNTCGASNSGSTVSFTTSGSVTVKANAPATDLYNAAEEVSYVLTVSKVPAATITALNISSVGAGTNGTLSATYTPAEDCDVTVTYATSNALVLSIDDTSYEAESGGNVTVTVTVTPDDTDVYETVSRGFAVTVTDTRTAPTFVFSASVVRANLEEKAQFEAPTLTNTSDGTLVFTSSDTDVATVNSSTGAVELLTVGTTTISATVSGSATYQNAQASYTLTVYVPTYTFAKVTDASSLRAGDKLIFVNESAKVAMGEKKDNNFDDTTITLSSGIATGVTNSPTSFLTLEGTAGAWYFNLNGKYLYAASSSSNYLKLEDEKDNNAKATISISTGNATITFQGSNTRNLLRYNSSSGLFSCYSSGQDVVQIYRMSELVTLPASIYATRSYERALDFSVTGIKAYTVKVNAEKHKARVTEIASGQVPAGEGVILYAEAADTYIVPVIASASALDNDLIGVTEETTVPWQTGDKYNYILQRSGSDYAFNKADGGTLAANRAYLQTTYDASDAGARLVLVFEDDDETTGIKSMHNAEFIMHNNEVYNLKGQRVEKPVKGQLYIVNGKKVVMK